MSKLLSRLSLRLQILSVGFIGVFGILALAAVYMVGTRSVEQQRGVADTATRLEMLTLAIHRGLLEGRRAEKDFFLRAEDKYAARHADQMRKVESDLAEARQLAMASGGGVELDAAIAEIRTGLGRYQQHFTASVELQRKLGLNENSGLQGALRSSVHAVETKLAAFEEPRLAALMLTMRRHEKDFLLRGDAKYLDDMKKRAAEFAQALAESSLDAKAQSEVAQGLSA